MTDIALPPHVTPKRTYLTVQGLRFLAAIMVVLVHSTFYAHERLTQAMPIYELGANGVRLFFVISGFVMIVSSRKLLAQPRGWRIFVGRRILRIVPLYWLVLTFKTLVLLLTTGLVLHATLDWSVVWKSYLFVPTYNADGRIEPLLGVGWTLNFEMFFYLLFAVALFARLRPIATLAPVLIGFVLLSLLRDATWPVPLYYYSSPIVLDFLAGMVIAHAFDRDTVVPGWIGWAAGIAGLTYLFVPVLRVPVPLLNSLVTTLAAAGVVIAAVVLEDRIGPRIPRAILFLGAASYSLYLTHPLVAPAAPLVLARLGLVWPTLSVISSMTIALVVGSLCYRFVETPMSSWFDRISKGWTWLSGNAASPQPDRATAAE